VEGHPEVGTQTVDKETTGIWIRLATIVTKRNILQLIVIPKVAVTKGITEQKIKKDSHATSNTSGMFVGACFECNKIGNENWGSMILENDERSFEMIG
jgi:hypothetical protein